MLSDIQIAQNADIKPITKIAEFLGIDDNYLELYGKYKAKVSLDLWDKIKNNKNGKLVLVTAINPTPSGEGKTTTTVGLGLSLCKLSKKATIALREPSMGPVMGLKGGAAGGGYSQVIPMEDINLHFTGDMHAITAANNLLCAAIDNHIHQGNELMIDPRQITFKRVMDMNDRTLRNIAIGLGGKVNGMPREDGFMITVASEIMAILCLSESIDDLKNRLSQIIIGYNFKGEPVFASMLKVEGAMAMLLKDAIKPNLVQTLENTPCFMHGGPFANIAHGCNSVIATKFALKLSEFVVTEAGFGADLGAEKFINIKCRNAGIYPSVVVIVATARALKYNGGADKENLKNEDLEALEKGIVNLETHIENIKKFNVPLVVAINKFESDTNAEISFIKSFCEKQNVLCSVNESFEKGSEGGIDLAKKVISLSEQKNENLEYTYDLKECLEGKIFRIVTKIYGGEGVYYTPAAKKQLEKIKKMGYAGLPVCMAKTQYSLSDNPSLLGSPKGFYVTVSDVRICSGAKFIVALTGEIMTMPGLPKKPSAENMDIDQNGTITGLF